ncbi:adenine/guanine permease AZG1-like [Dioscorea cayenensis subsp. rotundata]|uniref:Adenine/guanine permease AZG1-like n=1 Tax=Dioscorea cayennensis subsp. rotundata TaxID=55577 RepID=A0AB40C2Q7_DIOCR|nr:adenine/guanine permease AZG1-like [Dioscorea cayenensis subsp. rotundata]
MVTYLPRPVLTFLNCTTFSSPILCLHKMLSPTFWLAVVGFLIIAYCLIKNIKGGDAMIYNIVFITAVSWFRTPPSLPSQSGNYSFNYFKNVIDVYKIQSTSGTLSFSGISCGYFWEALLTFLYIDILDTTETLNSMSRFTCLVDDNGHFEGQYFVFMSEARAIITSSLRGTSPVTALIELYTGIREGGRTRLMAIIVASYFMLSFFFMLLLELILARVVGPLLVLVRVLMMKFAVEIDWEDMREAISAFMTLILMLLTYSIAYVMPQPHSWAR